MTTTSAEAPDEVATKSIAACAHAQMAIGQFAYKNQASNNTNWSMTA